MTTYVLTLGAPQPEAATVNVLQQAQAALDELAARQAGSLAVIPTSTGSIAADEYHDITYVAWPRYDYQRINTEWQKVAAFSSKSPFGANAEVADLMNSWLDMKELTATVRLKTAVTVDQARIAIRNLLRTLPAPKPPAAAPTPTPSPTPSPAPSPGVKPPPSPPDAPPPPPITFPQKASSKWLWWVVGGGGVVAAAAVVFVVATGKKKPVKASDPVAGARPGRKSKRTGLLAKD
jgi:hypothetical protein